MIFKTLSVSQPWAWLLVNGFKNIENRVWSTAHRGPLLIHAGRGRSPEWRRNRFANDEALEAIFRRLRAMGIEPPEVPPPDKLETGGIVGRVTLVDCIREPALNQVTLLTHTHPPELNSPWFMGPVGWVVIQASPLPFVETRGYLRLFEFDYEPPKPPRASKRSRTTR